MTKITNTYNNFTGLIPGTSYTVTVAGINKAGTGESSTVTFHLPTKCQSTMSGITSTGKFMFIMIYNNILYHRFYHRIDILASCLIKKSIINYTELYLILGLTREYMASILCIYIHNMP